MLVDEGYNETSCLGPFFPGVSVWFGVCLVCFGLGFLLGSLRPSVRSLLEWLSGISLGLLRLGVGTTQLRPSCCTF